MRLWYVIIKYLNHCPKSLMSHQSDWKASKVGPRLSQPGLDAKIMMVDMVMQLIHSKVLGLTYDIRP